MINFSATLQLSLVTVERLSKLANYYITIESPVLIMNIKTEQTALNK